MAKTALKVKAARKPKFAVRGFTEALRQEMALAGHPVKVSCVHPGGIKTRTAGGILGGAHPERVVIKAVERMISRNPLGRQQMRKLHVYKGADHPHQAQNPEVLDVAAMNPKNKRSA